MVSLRIATVSAHERTASSVYTAPPRRTTSASRAREGPAGPGLPALGERPAVPAGPGRGVGGAARAPAPPPPPPRRSAPPPHPGTHIAARPRPPPMTDAHPSPPPFPPPKAPRA